MTAERRACVDDISKWKDRIKVGDRIKTPEGTQKVTGVFPFVCKTDVTTFTWGELYFINQRPLLSSTVS